MQVLVIVNIFLMRSKNNGYQMEVEGWDNLADEAGKGLTGEKDFLGMGGEARVQTGTWSKYPWR